MLTEEQNKLVEENIKLAYHFALVWRRKLAHIYGELDDMESLCMIALTKAAKAFDPSRELKFATLVSVCCRNEVYMAIRRNKKHKNVLSLHDFFQNTSKSHDQGWKDSIEFTKAASIGDGIEEWANRELLYHMIHHVLDDKERFIIYHRYWEGWSQKDCAEYFGTNQSWMSRVERRALAKMRKYARRKEAI